ncbi:hypothetical protein NUACC21_36760 [Scytonema sp. NUACC21]
MIQLNSPTTYSKQSLTLTAIVDTALCVGAGGSSGSLADKPIVRTAKGELLIPASQLKGRVRYECEKLARGLHLPVCDSPNPQTMCPQRAGFTKDFNRRFQNSNFEIKDCKGYHCPICQIFGNPVLPSRVLFDDLICTEDPANLPEVLRPGVTLNRRRRIAEDQKLFFLETSPVNIQLSFQGDIHILPGCPPYTKALLLAALRHIHALGGSKSGGLGWLHWQFSPQEIDNTVWNALLLE